MKRFWAENKWYLLAIGTTLLVALLYLWFNDGPKNLLPEVYSVM